MSAAPTSSIPLTNWRQTLLAVPEAERCATQKSLIRGLELCDYVVDTIYPLAQLNPRDSKNISALAAHIEEITLFGGWDRPFEELLSSPIHDKCIEGLASIAIANSGGAGTRSIGGLSVQVTVTVNVGAQVLGCIFSCRSWLRMYEPEPDTVKIADSLVSKLGELAFLSEMCEASPKKELEQEI